jgi:hypothetical protein
MRPISTDCFSNEETDHVCGTGNGHNCRVWGSESPHDVTEHESDSPKVSEWWALMKNSYWSFLF